ncbi:uncharacterized protein AKAW2_21015A [Aspergillus luchuensis]|uniref:Uncharacterized protein n=1 Tax=Aspergillus kawachii TaxID=1069201 RepID=A0A7R7W491_ASPKA|nr:uncharacterized protein AKAW2_21015A [Aspergillus luchuensis]BCR96075.1 hypothetical protein AKAW2_21015A [Aspergillus luchuensis]
MATWQVHFSQSQYSDNELQEDSNPEARFKGSTDFGKSGSPANWFPLPPVQRPHSEQPSIQSNPNPVHAFRSISSPLHHPVSYPIGLIGTGEQSDTTVGLSPPERRWT